MDYRSAVIVAQRNVENTNKKEIKYYSTKFEPPKKLQRNKTLSANIQKFLAQKDEEEKQKAVEARERRDKLLELRSQDKKATRRVNVMLKRTKSANKAVIADAIDKDNTSVTLAGPSQPDEDDYGYVSQSAADFYNKMMEKYNNMPDEPKYNFGRKKGGSNLSTTKDRVRAALIKEQETELQPQRRKRKTGEVEMCDDEITMERKDESRVKPKLKSAPVINFNDLLKIAEKKQFEPIKIEPKKEKEEERLLTKKQKREAEKERESRDQREKRDKERLLGIQQQSSKSPRPPISEKTTNAKSLKPTCDNSSKRSEIPRLNNSGKTNNAAIVKKVPAKPTKSKELTPKDIKPKELPARELKPKQIPDTRRKPVMKSKPMAVSKGRIYDDDDEHDSEMDDFIDDGPEEEEDYSKAIGEIFGYDKRKYRHLEEDDDDRMESTFAQQMREEVISSKIGMMEDLEELRREEDHARRKAMMKKRMS